MHMLEKKIRAATAAGRYALIPFLTAGYPEKERFWQALADLDAHGADILEIGVPFSDPVADGPVVEDASRQALAAGVTLKWLLKELRQRRGHFQAGLVLMGYFNPFLQYGLERLAEDAAKAGVHGFIVPDLPYEESAPLRAALREKNIALVPLVGPNTTLERMRLYAREGEGYAYAVSVMGTTGVRGALSDQVAATLRRARQAFDLPVALGFGLREPGQLDALAPDARPDAAVFGSALIRHLDSGKPARDFLRAWR